MKYLLFALFMSLSTLALAADIVWVPRYDESHVTFTSTESGQEREGGFEAFTADIRFDPDHLEDSRVDVVIETDSIIQPDEDRNTTVRAAQWFDIAHFPEARFTAEDFEKTGENTYIAHGTLTIKGISRAVDLPFTLDIAGDVAMMRGEAAVLRLDHNLGSGEWADTSFVANEVRVNVTLVADRKTP